MKKSFFLLLFIPALFFSQSTEEKDKDFKLKNEVFVNAFDLVAAGTLDLGYERYLKNNQSIAFQASFFDSFAYLDTGYDGYKSKSTSLKLSYNIYFSLWKLSKGFVFYPFMRYRFGNSEYKDYYYENGVEHYGVRQQSLDAFLMGFGLGNKWRIANDRITLGLYGELGRVLGGKMDTDYYSVVEPRLRVNLGFTF